MKSVPPKKHSKEYEKFEQLARKIVSVPKKDIQEREAIEKASKTEVRKQQS